MWREKRGKEKRTEEDGQKKEQGRGRSKNCYVRTTHHLCNTLQTCWNKVEQKECMTRQSWNCRVLGRLWWSKADDKSQVKAAHASMKSKVVSSIKLFLMHTLRPSFQKQRKTTKTQKYIGQWTNKKCRSQSLLFTNGLPLAECKKQIQKCPLTLLPPMSKCVSEIKVLTAGG